jgi:hypothetical protein
MCREEFVRARLSEAIREQELRLVVVKHGGCSGAEVKVSGMVRNQASSCMRSEPCACRTGGGLISVWLEETWCMVHADGELAETNGVKNSAIYRERRVALDCAGLDRDKGSGVFRLEGRKQNADTYG